MMDAADDDEDDLLAVYGTLLAGLEPNAAPAKAGRLTLLGACRIAGRLDDCGAYPALTLDDGGRVLGELYRVVDPSVWADLDAYEGQVASDPARSLFHRVRTTLVDPPCCAWVYVGGTARRLRPIPDGDWRAWCAARRRDSDL